MDDNGEKVCEICKFSDSNDYDYGQWKTADGCTVHYFCALLSSDTVTKGESNEGIEGFLVEDIRKVSGAYTKTKCSYCPKKRATVRCCEPNCKRVFHVVCGVKRKCQNQFIEPYYSFCHLHVKIEEKAKKHEPDLECNICFEPMGEYDLLTSIPSCCNDDYYHKLCIQKHAVKLGLLAKCPSCGNDADGYRKFLSLRGIFCPIKDADYELSKEPFVSLLYVHNRCDANECRCPKGREYTQKSGKWQYYRCYFCGSVGTHAACRDDDKSNESFGCRECTEKHSQDMQLQGAANHTMVIDANAADAAAEENDSNMNPYSRKHPFDAEGDGKVWKQRRVKDSFKTRTLELMEPDDDADDSVTEKNCEKQMLNDRMALFFANADFDSKPRPPPWLI